MKNLNFGSALQALKSGRKVTREGWNNPEIWLEMQFPDENSKMTEPYIFMRKYDKKFPNSPSVESIIAEDWMII